MVICRDKEKVQNRPQLFPNSAAVLNGRAQIIDKVYIHLLQEPVSMYVMKTVLFMNFECIKKNEQSYGTDNSVRRA